MNFCQLIAKKYGNSKARWASGKLKVRQKVKIIIRDPEFGDRLVEAVATGRKSRKKNVVRYQDPKGRIWLLPMDNDSILVEW